MTAASASSHGQRSSSVSAMPARILSASHRTANDSVGLRGPNWVRVPVQV